MAGRVAALCGSIDSSLSVTHARNLSLSKFTNEEAFAAEVIEFLIYERETGQVGLHAGVVFFVFVRLIVSRLSTSRYCPCSRREAAVAQYHDNCVGLGRTRGRGGLRLLC